MSSASHQTSQFRQWLDWALGRTSSPPAEPEESEASLQLASIGKMMRTKRLSTEIRLMIFGYVLQNEPPYDISSQSRIPERVTKDLEGIWFRNTNFFLPVPDHLGAYEPNTDVTLENNTINFLDRLANRGSSQPVTVEVVILDNGVLENSQASFHRLLLASYYLKERKDLLDIKFVIKTQIPSGEKFEATPDIVEPLKARFLQDCKVMRDCQKGTIGMKEVFALAEAEFDPEIVQVFSPESLVARILSRKTSEAGIYAEWPYHSRVSLRVKIIMALKEAPLNREDSEEEEE